MLFGAGRFFNIWLESKIHYGLCVIIGYAVCRDNIPFIGGQIHMTDGRLHAGTGNEITVLTDNTRIRVPYLQNDSIELFVGSSTFKIFNIAVMPILSF